MNTLTINELTNLLNNDNQTNTKKSVHLSNDILIAMAQQLNKNAKINVENTRSNKMVNRGSTFEILFKMILKEKFNANVKVEKSQANEKDLDTSDLTNELAKMLELPQNEEIELKLSTSFANGSKIKSNKNISVLVANSKGIYLGKANDLERDNKLSIKPNQPKFKRLKTLSKIMGY